MSDETPEVFYHETPKDKCKHEFDGWREFDDKRGGEAVCVKCGIGALEWSLRYLP